MSREVPVESSVGAAIWVERGWYAALAVSTVVHLSAIVATSLVPVEPQPLDTGRKTIESEWSSGELKTELTSFEPTVEVPVIQADRIPGGSDSAAAAIAVEDSNTPVNPTEPLRELPEISSWIAELAKQNDLARVVGPVHSGKSSKLGTGNGGGAGNGTGNGLGQGQFFDTKAEGKRFVFVVDRSRSMNYPYPGEYKTRFNRVKIEIGRSITQMNAEAEFYIIFFNDGLLPMPTESYLPVGSDARAKSFEWLAAVPADGNTDPRPALRMALNMKPDAIYFLTDGEFQPEISHDLESLVQRNVPIHTFSLANPNAEKTLKAVAEHNGGQYTFVP